MTAPLFVLLAGGRWDGVQFGVHSIAAELATRGRVLFVDPPMSVQAAVGARRPILESVQDTLHVLRPVVPPGHSRPGTRRLAGTAMQRSVRWAARRLGGPVEAVIAFSPRFDVFGVCGERRRVYYAKDDVASGAKLMGVDANALERAEQRCAETADVLVAASEEIARRWRERGHDALLIPNGVDFDHCATASSRPKPADVGLSGPIAGFVGHLSKRIDPAYLDAVASTGISLLLVGPRQQTLDPRAFDEVLGRPNVQWLGQRPYADLPAYLGVIDVGLVPYAASAFNTGSFPLKILQHLAAGRALCSTDLPAVRWLRTDLIDIATSPSSFASAVERRAARPPSAAEVAARQELARTHDWSVRVDQLVDAVRS